MVRDITLGQYFPGKSFIHSMDARVKILITFAFIILSFVGNNFVSLGIVSISVILIMMFSQVPIKMYIKSFKVIILIIIFTAGLNVFYGKGEPIFKLGFVTVTQQGINNAIFVAVRIISLLMISSVLTFTTSPTDLTYALEKLMSPLKKLNIKVHEMSMMMTIALRFVPTLLEESDKIMNAQKARGADLETGNLLQRTKALIPILVPLFVSSFKRAYDLAIAMECRCYKGGEGRTSMKVLKIKKNDILAMLFTMLVISGVVLCNVLIPRI